MTCKTCEQLIKEGKKDPTKPCPECEWKVLVGQTTKFCKDTEKSHRKQAKKELGSSCDVIAKKVMAKKVELGTFIEKVDKIIPSTPGKERPFDAIIELAKERNLLKDKK